MLFGVQPLSTEWSTELTPPVREALGALLDAVIEQLRFGPPATSRRTPKRAV